MWEIRLILADLGFPILSMEEADAEPEIMENGLTFGENTGIKARAAWNLTEDIVPVDDSGLKVNYIGGELGIYSARYLGEDAPYAVKNRSIIERLKETGSQERSARFTYSIAAMLLDGQVFHTEAVTEGLIIGEPTGEGGFGYDFILYLPEFGKTSTGITMDQKNEISHRGRALGAMKEALEGVLK